jgi:hypothetical protein
MGPPCEGSATFYPFSLSSPRTQSTLIAKRMDVKSGRGKLYGAVEETSLKGASERRITLAALRAWGVLVEIDY